MRVIIAGGRDYKPRLGDAVVLGARLNQLQAQEIVSGCARGADAFGEQVAGRLALPVKRFPADWAKHGIRAGPIRNQQMANYADALLALPGGKGTLNMVEEAELKGLKVFKIGW